MTQELDSLHSSLGEAERYAKELEGRLAEREWQPIETAPNTGHILVIGGPHEAVTIRPADGDFWRREKVGPTHWMPLPPPPTATLRHNNPKFKIGDRVRKIKGSSWQGPIVGSYSTPLTPEGYAVMSEREVNSVQIYPASALELVSA